MAKKLNSVQAFEVTAFVKEICIANEAGYAIYKQPWTDQLVADKYKPTIPFINPNHIATIRKAHIGNLQDSPAGAYGKIAELQKVVEGHTAHIQSLQTQLNTVIKELQALKSWSHGRGYPVK